MSNHELRTDDLIKALAADAPSVSRLGMMSALALAMIPAAALSFLILLASVGVRPDLAAAFLGGPVAFKFAVTITLAVSALLLSVRISRPDQNPHIPFYLLPPILLVLCGLLFEVVATRTGVKTAMLENTPAACVGLILLFSLPPLIAAFFIMRRGAARHPAFAGAATGLFAAGIGATVYALHCPNDDAIYVGVWYGLAAAIAAGVGALLGRKILSW